MKIREKLNGLNKKEGKTFRKENLWKEKHRKPTETLVKEKRAESSIKVSRNNIKNEN